MSCDKRQQIRRRTRDALASVFLLATLCASISMPPAIAGAPPLVAGSTSVCSRSHWTRIRRLCNVAQRFDRRIGSTASELAQNTSATASDQLPAATGTVTMGGEPMKQGTIEFHGGPEPKNKIKVDIRGGRFAIPEGQLPPGKYRIEIRSEPEPAEVHSVKDVP